MRQLLALLAFTLFTVGAYAQGEWQYGDYTAHEHRIVVADTVPAKMADKWARGMINLLTGVAEIPVRTIQGYEDGSTYVENEVGSKALGSGLGLFRGFGFAASRIGHGVFEMVTFWAANPASNQRIGWHFDTDYAWEFKVEHKLRRSSLMAEEIDNPDTNMFMPVGRKLKRGANDFFLGASELWYQPKEAYYTKNSTGWDVAGGVGRGFWYFLSREFHGAQDILFFLAASPERQVGPAYTIADPWNFLGKPEDAEDLGRKYGL